MSTTSYRSYGSVVVDMGTQRTSISPVTLLMIVMTVMLSVFRVYVLNLKVMFLNSSCCLCEKFGQTAMVMLTF